MANASLGDDKIYEDLRRLRFSKERSARTSKAVARRGRPAAGRKGEDAGSYYDWSVAELKRRAKELGMTGYSTQTKEELIYRLRYR